MLYSANGPEPAGDDIHNAARGRNRMELMQRRASERPQLLGTRPRRSVALQTT